MTEKIKVWTKQHENIRNDLDQNGRYLVKKEYIVNKMEEHAGIYLDTYNWLYHSASKFMEIPNDAKYPIWVSVTEESKIQNSEGNVLLEILVDPEKLFIMDLDKWGYIVNYMYIPKDPEDAREHDVLLKRYGIDDSTAYMSPFYPSVKNKIRKSWDRLFDAEIELSPARVGIIWEVKKEWIVKMDS
ncbi:MAG: DUF3841 domain-containing protein [Lacrimispora celerecrescens]|nr:DUF3841 domain-containing protein [Lacrimispora celerecrescens]